VEFEVLGLPSVAAVCLLLQECKNSAEAIKK
jgi:hypothetical protein